MNNNAAHTRGGFSTKEGDEFILGRRGIKLSPVKINDAGLEVLGRETP
jgi:hypothetical protein